jgi:hypothetical protein
MVKPGSFLKFYLFIEGLSVLPASVSCVWLLFERSFHSFSGFSSCIRVTMVLFVE